MKYTNIINPFTSNLQRVVKVEAGKTLYVDKTIGSDNNDGSISAPFATIMKAINTIIDNGDNESNVPYCIELGAGVYEENVVLENTKLKNIQINGRGRQVTKIEPSSGNSIQSTKDNNNIVFLEIAHITIGKPIEIIGATDSTTIGELVFSNGVIWNTTITLENINYMEFNDSALLSSSTLNINNVAMCGIGDGCTVGEINLESDENANKPNNWNSSTGTYLLLSSCVKVGDTSFNLLNGGKGNIQVRDGVRFSSDSITVTIPSDVTFTCYNSSLRGNYINNGTLTLVSSEITGTLTGNAPNIYRPASQIKNDSSITGDTVKDVLNLISNNIDNNNYIIPKSSDNVSAPNNSIFYSTDNSKLVYKDNSGNIHDLH